MANYTTNYNLKKPLGSERYDIGVDNTNCDVIDGALLGLSTALTLHTNDGSKHPDITQLQTDVTNLNSTVTPHVAAVASTTIKGHIQLATATEVTAGVDTTKAVTPATAKVELDKKISHSLAVAANDFLVASGYGIFVKKTLDEVKTILGLGTAAYTPSTNYATAVHTHDYSPTSHTHDFSVITGTVPVSQGGTGQTTLALARNAMGLGNTTGALPIENGGTGQITAALARNALGLGNTTGALPVANGGTGATTAAAALTALGLTATAAEINAGMDGLTATAAELNHLDGITATVTELNYSDGVTSNIQAQLDAKALKAPTKISVTASKTLALTDAGTVQTCENASAITITIPTNATIALPLYTEIAFVRYGAGTVTFAPASGVTIASSGSKKSIKNQYESAAIKKVNTDLWILVGSLSA